MRTDRMHRHALPPDPVSEPSREESSDARPWPRLAQRKPQCLVDYPAPPRWNASSRPGEACDVTLLMPLLRNASRSSGGPTDPSLSILFPSPPGDPARKCSQRGGRRARQTLTPTPQCTGAPRGHGGTGVHRNSGSSVVAPPRQATPPSATCNEVARGRRRALRHATAPAGGLAAMPR